MGSKFLTDELFQDPQLKSTERTIRAGTAIYQPTTPARNLYLLKRGEVRLYMVNTGADSRLVRILGPGDWFGVGALAGHKNYWEQAVAVSHSALIEAAADRFMRVLATRPEALLELTQRLAGRLLDARHDASLLVFEDSDQRVINALVRFSQSAAATRHDHEVVLRMTHDQLARAVGVARETVSMALKELRRQNLLRTGRNQLIFDPEALRKLCITSGASAGCCSDGECPDSPAV